MKLLDYHFSVYLEGLLCPCLLTQPSFKGYPKKIW